MENKQTFMLLSHLYIIASFLVDTYFKIVILAFMGILCFLCFVFLSGLDSKELDYEFEKLNKELKLLKDGKDD